MRETVCENWKGIVVLCAQDVQYGIEKGLEPLNVLSISKKGLDFKAKLQKNCFVVMK